MCAGFQNVEKHQCRRLHRRKKKATAVSVVGRMHTVRRYVYRDVYHQSHNFSLPTHESGVPLGLDPATDPAIPRVRVCPFYSPVKRSNNNLFITDFASFVVLAAYFSFRKVEVLFPHQRLLPLPLWTRSVPRWERFLLPNNENEHQVGHLLGTFCTLTLV